MKDKTIDVVNDILSEYNRESIQLLTVYYSRLNATMTADTFVDTLASDIFKEAAFPGEMPGKMPTLTNDEVLAQYGLRPVISPETGSPVLLGKGAFGSVEKYETTDSTPVAVKFIQIPEMGRRKRAFNSLNREITALKHVGSMETGCKKRIVCFHTMLVSATHFIIVMEYIDGYELKNIKFESINTPDKLNLLLEIANGVKDMHDEGVAHWDLKPANIMIEKTTNDTLGDVKIVDFGVGCIDGLDAEFDCTRFTHEFSGTPNYTAAETWKRATKNAFARDIFSLGVLFYWVLSNGNVVYKGRNITELQTKIINEQRVDLYNGITMANAGIKSDIAMSLTGLIADMTLYKAKQRPSIDACIAELSKIRRGLEISKMVSAFESRLGEKPIID